MLAGLPFALVALVGLVAWGVGGYAPWATLVLEMGAVGLAGWLLSAVLFSTTDEAREHYLTLARSQRKQRGDVEILTPSSRSTERSFRDAYYVLGFPFRRLGGAALPLGLMTLWAAASIVPLPPALSSLVSPVAFELRSEVAALEAAESTWTPWSLTPFLTFQDLLLWIGYVLLFLVAFHVADSSRAVRRLSAGLVLLGAASGAYGLVQWLTALSGDASNGLAATGSFGNRNHYAYFQEMLLIIGVGWLSLSWTRASRKPGDRRAAQEAKARTALVALAVTVTGLGLVFSLSRSGIAFTVAAIGAFVLWNRERGSTSRRAALGLAAAAAAALLWIGIDPVVERFELAPGDLTGERGRAAVWKDSLGALGDFWLTGSGLSSFQYVYPMYRSFGGLRFYSWAHNDYLQLAIELGLPGLALALVLGVWAVRRIAKTRERLAADVGLSKLHAGYCAALLVAALHSFTDFGLHLPANAALFAVLTGVATGMSPSRRKRVAQRAPSPV